ncbi:hypothetical protein ACQGSH_21060 [Bacillus wiedmannii]|uniref:hypothetical protein n=1 Tax=Bacillus TaxID=1386 RepID=UPI0019132E0A|nr:MULTISPECIES: hypothetical protein [Bacillus]MBK5490916.1 hypothetical protein [Bacillus sp. TH17]MCX3317219.1 hypothetical protein [Bacillus wiedmannii]
MRIEKKRAFVDYEEFINSFYDEIFTTIMASSTISADAKVQLLKELDTNLETVRFEAFIIEEEE